MFKKVSKNVNACYICGLVGQADVDRCNSLADEGGRVTALQWDTDASEYIWDESLPRRFKTKVVGVNTPASACSVLRGLLYLIRHCLKENSHTYFIYGYQRVPFFVLAIILRVCGRQVFSINDSKFDDYPRSYARDSIKWLMLLPYDGYLAASRRAEAYLQYFGMRNIAVYHCAIDIKRAGRHSIHAEKKTAYWDRDFVMIARFIPKKNHKALLDAYEIFANKTRQARRLVLCGYGPLESELRNYVSKSEHLTRLVHFTGYLDSSEVGKLLARSLVLFLPSLEDQFGIVATEALANSVPVVISERCGAVELIKSGVNGFKVGATDVDSLVYFMEFFSTNEAAWEKMSAAAFDCAMNADVSVFLDAVRKLQVVN